MIKIVGGGPSGISFAISYLINSRKDEKIKVYEGERNYEKPCGEALLNLNMNIYYVEPEILHEIKDFYIYDGENLIEERHYSSGKWFIIDKRKWIEEHRRYAEKSGILLSYEKVNPFKEKNGSEDLVIDATGPFSFNKLRKIPIARAIISSDLSLESEVKLIFDAENIGFYWVFPSAGKLINVGYGSLLIKNPTSKLMEFMNKKFRNLRILNIKTSLITLQYRAKPIYTFGYTIGEANGTVFSLTGEGIRPSYVQSSLLGKFLIELRDFNKAYNTVINHADFKELSDQLKLQYNLLTIYQKLPLSMRRSLLRRIKHAIDDYITKNVIDPRKVLFKI